MPSERYNPPHDGVIVNMSAILGSIASNCLLWYVRWNIFSTYVLQLESPSQTLSNDTHISHIRWVDAKEIAH